MTEPKEPATPEEVTRYLGKGGFSRAVLHHYPKKGQKFVRKTAISPKPFKGDEVYTLLTLAEAHFLMALAPSDLIVELYDYTVTSLDLEVGDTDLGRLINREPALVAERRHVFARDLFGALSHCHRKGVVHADLKPENLLVFGDRLKLSDFNTAVWRSRIGAEIVPHPWQTTTSCYRAPELYARQADCTEAIDVWSAGVVLYEIYTRARYPFGNDCSKVVWGRIQECLGPYSPAPGKDAPRFSAAKAAVLASGLEPAPEPGLVALLDSILQYEHAARPTAEKTLATLQDVCC